MTSFDYDPQSVETTRRLHALAGSPSNWTVNRGDILDPVFLSSLSPHDIVYSWGVLHHTGAMWEAIRNAGRFVSENGLFSIALYTTDAYWKPSTDFWLAVKQRYNRGGEFTRASMEWWYFWRFIGLGELRHFRNPFRLFRNYAGSRGMSLWTDIRDWLGGLADGICGNHGGQNLLPEGVGTETRLDDRRGNLYGVSLLPTGRRRHT